MKRRKLFTTVATALLLGWAFVMLRPLFSGSRLIGQPAPDFTLPIAMGPGAPTDRLRLSDLRGQVVVLDFWASWCGPCKDSIPTLSKVAKRYAGRGAQVIGINSEPVGPGLMAFLEDSWGFAYPTVSDTALQARRAYDVNAYPSLFVLDPQGIVRFMHRGGTSEQRLISEINSIIK